MPDGWPERPAFARFRLEVAVKSDGRNVTFYDWPEDPDDDHSSVPGEAAEAAPGRQADDGV